MKSGKLRSETHRVSEIDDGTREAMWKLFERYYADVQQSTFETDLAGKTHVILLFDDGDLSVQGFSTVQVYRHKVDLRWVQVVFSGDTIIDRSYWGQGVVQRAYAALFVRLKLSRPLEPLYYFLLSKGYKTYLLLTRSYPEFWPRHDRVTPAGAQAVLDALAYDKFGTVYDRRDGILRMGSPAGRLREEVAPVTSKMLEDPDIRFFMQKNPGHVRADELCCLAPVTFSTPLRYLASRMLREARARTAGSVAEPTR
jgi:hypothetical protein